VCLIAAVLAKGTTCAPTTSLSVPPHALTHLHTRPSPRREAAAGRRPVMLRSLGNGTRKPSGLRTSSARKRSNAVRRGEAQGRGAAKRRGAARERGSDGKVAPHRPVTLMPTAAEPPTGVVELAGHGANDVLSDIVPLPGGNRVATVTSAGKMRGFTVATGALELELDGQKVDKIGRLLTALGGDIVVARYWPQVCSLERGQRRATGRSGGCERSRRFCRARWRAVCCRCDRRRRRVLQTPPWARYRRNRVHLESAQSLCLRHFCVWWGSRDCVVRSDRGRVGYRLARAACDPEWA
jgi:hypothetical protein